MPVKVRHIDFSSDEWLGGTIGIGNADRGLYITACAMIYAHGGAIKIDDLFAACVDHGNALKLQLSRLVSAGKLTRNGQEIDQKRCRKELEKARKRMGKARQNGAKGGRSNGLAKPAGFPSSKAITNHQPPTTNKKGRSPPTRHPPSPEAPTAPVGAGTSSPRPILENQNVRGTRLPADWQPSAADREFAFARGLDPGAVADQFADHWRAETGTRAVKLDWAATWRNWCRRQHEPGRERRGASSIAAALSRVRFAGED